MVIVGGRLARAAYYFAHGAHASCDQRRKYTNEPYIVHPVEVALTVSSVPHTDEMLAAAYLHDVVEDTNVSSNTIADVFGEKVANYVWYLTDCENRKLNRAERKHRDWIRLQIAPNEVKTVKVADLISNTKSIVQHDPSFAKVYLAEKARVLEALIGADPHLLSVAKSQLKQSLQKLELV